MKSLFCFFIPMQIKIVQIAEDFLIDIIQVFFHKQWKYWNMMI